MTVRNRFKATAARRGLELAFPRTNGNLLRFRLAPGSEPAEAVALLAAELEPAAEPEPPAASQPTSKGRGRRTKVAAAPAV